MTLNLATQEVRPADQISALARRYPPFRLMGSKHRLLPWIHRTLADLKFNTALDAFSGSGCVSYLLKSMGKTITANDFLRFSFHFARALTVNPGVQLSEKELAQILESSENPDDFIYQTFHGIFFTETDLHLLDNVWSNLKKIRDQWKRSLVIAAMCRSAMKKQPRGVFTVRRSQASKYDDGRRDTRLSLKQHFVETVALFNSLVYDDGRSHLAVCGDVFHAPIGADLVYMDPPYVPRSDDNCYVKRYHFVEGLASYWEGLEILEESKVKKLRKRFTPFSYRRTAPEAFHELFRRFADSILVLSYSSNGYPELQDLVQAMKRYKRRVTVSEQAHRYHFGTHNRVHHERAVVREYLIVGE